MEHARARVLPVIDTIAAGEVPFWNGVEDFSPVGFEIDDGLRQAQSRLTSTGRLTKITRCAGEMDRIPVGPGNPRSNRRKPKIRRTEFVMTPHLESGVRFQNLRLREFRFKFRQAGVAVMILENMTDE